MSGNQFYSFAGMNSAGGAKEGGDDDLYGGFSAAPQQTFGTIGTLGGAGGGANPLQPPPPSQGGFWNQQPPSTQAGIWRPPGSAAGGAGFNTQSGGGDNRPMTSNRATGYSSHGHQFDPLKQGSKLNGPPPPLQKKSENSPEEQCLEMERQVNILIEESAQLSLQKDYPLALEKAKEASKKERYLCRQREQLGLGDQINIDLTYSVHFNLAVQYHHNALYTEALNTYSLIVRNKQYAMSGRLRVNMGNIYMEQGKHTLAIKMYRMALDQIPNTAKDLRFKIMRNIGNAFVKTGGYQEAINSYEGIMEGSPDIITGFNLLLCYYALGDREKLKRHFTKLLNIRKYGASDDDDDLMLDEFDDNENKDALLLDDGLKAEIRDKRKQHMNYLLTAARLIAPMIEKDWQAGFDYIIEQLRHYELKDSSSRLAAEMEMCKALNFMKHKKYTKAIDALKAFERKDRQLKAKAATNLGYLFFLEGDTENGEKYSNLAVEADKYNAKALTNRGNFFYIKGEFDRAKEFYMESLAVEADCIEALYNLGLATKQLQQYEESLRVFKKLQTMIPDSVEVIYQIANLYDLMCDNHRACEWFHRLITRVPTDPNVLARLGSIYSKEDDEPQAFHYHLEAYRYFPVNMDVISWLGAYFVKNEVYEKAMQFFERASQIQPNEVKWQLMVASCHRRIGAYPQAKRLYEDIHKKYTDNVECLRYLVHICNDSGMKDEAVEFHRKLKKLEARLENPDGFGLPQSRGGPAGYSVDDDDDDATGRIRGSGSSPPSRSGTPPPGDKKLPYSFSDNQDSVAAHQPPAASAPTVKKESTSAARHAKREQELENEMKKMEGEDDDLDVDEMLPMGT
eukprot:TRINITY_DN23666_c0_g1_i1.p1 TRINITY_DN23666_c0_g1~~TRINITY_DN23666_c0_g1_i1.p1  ORF type:complete len:851 (+),score=132.77 TRINITY_DN23666_c0_g1_i1:98-2650(+)